jgi:hypothetical protein
VRAGGVLRRDSRSADEEVLVIRFSAVHDLDIVDAYGASLLEGCGPASLTS